MLGEEEFVAYMKQDFPQLKITREDLAHPSKQFATTYYWSMLESVMRINPRLLVRPNPHQERILQSATAAGLQENIALINLYKTLQYIFSKMNFQTEFRHSDLIAPFLAPRRSFVFMASLYQLFTHCAVFDDKFDTVDKTSKNGEIITQLKQEQEALKEKIAQREESKKVMVERSAEIKSQLAELADINEQQELTLKALEHEKDVEREKLLVIERQEQVLQSEMEKAENEKKYLESLIVSDAGDVMEGHGNYLKKRDESYHKLRGLEQQVAEKSAKANQLDTVLGLYTSLVETLRDEVLIGKKSFDLKALQISLALEKKNCQLLKKDENELEALVAKKLEEKAVFSTDLSSLTEEYEQKSLAHTEQVTSYKARIKSLQQQLSNFEQKSPIEDASHRDMKATHKKLCDRLQQIEAELKASDAFHMKRYEEWQQRFIDILREIDDNARTYRESALKRQV